MRVFISGSGSIKKLPDSAIKKIDSIIGKGFTIITGGAKDVEAQVQKYLSKKKYDRAIVCFTDGSTIANNADCALMIWDGLSIEILNIIKAMKDRNKGFCLIVDGVFYDEENSDIIINTLTNR
jgi:hypothetical protein